MACYNSYLEPPGAPNLDSCGCVFSSASDKKYGLVIVLLTEP